jgi:hypothetical protein
MVDSNLILGAVAFASVVAAAIPGIMGFLEKKRRDEREEAELKRKADAEEAERRRDHELRQAILRNDLVRDATAGQESTQYARRLRTLAGCEEKSQ